MHAIEATALTKQFAKHKVVDGVDLTVQTGTLHALLGPNGSGKTTLVSMLATLLNPTSGRAAICGFDTVHSPREVKRRIGLVGQFHAVDPRLTGRENLTMFARLGGNDARSARVLASDTLERFGLTEAESRPVHTYSGGMRRRLDIIAGFIVRPTVLFLDEPTTGLDPHSRNQIYEHIEGFVKDGTTVLLTTQYLDEADRLADSVTILDAGRVVTTGTPRELTGKLGIGVDIDIRDITRIQDLEGVVNRMGGVRTESARERSESSLSFVFDAPSVSLLSILRALDAEHIVVDDIGRRHATLDDVFLALTRAGATI